MDTEILQVSIEEQVAAHINDSARKFLFSSYRLFREFLSYPEFGRYPNKERVNEFSTNFRYELNYLVNDLINVEANVSDSGGLSATIDAIVAFTRLTHLCEITLFTPPAEAFMCAIGWLQVFLRLNTRIYSFLTE